MPRFDRSIYPDSATARAVEQLGGITPTMQLCGVTARTVQQWLKGGGVPSTVHALALADAVQVDVRELAPPRRQESRGRSPGEVQQ